MYLKIILIRSSTNVYVLIKKVLRLVLATAAN